MRKLTLAQVKALAKKGAITVALFPSKCGPANTTWVQGVEIEVTAKQGIDNLWDFYILEADGFDISLKAYLDTFKAYICNYELGYYIHFYIKEDHNL